MEDYLKELLKEFQIESNKVTDITVAKLADNKKIFEISKSIKEQKLLIIDLFNMQKEKEEFKEAHIIIPNANAKKEYNFSFDLSMFPNIIIQEIKNLELVGLQYDAEKSCIFGVPSVANTIDIQIIFFNTKDENLETDIKVASFIVNADPKDLWLNKPSPIDSRFYKEESINFKSAFLDKKIVVASKRGRSHAHNGTFRDDDFLVKQLPNDWAIVAVADGAGSAKFARTGSKFACEFISESFNNDEVLNNLSQEVNQYFSNETENIQKIETNEESENVAPPVSENTTIEGEILTESIDDLKIKSKSYIINLLYKNVKELHEALAKYAESEEITLKDIHTTLIFTLVKKFNFGYVVLSFGVGDCPINVINVENTEVQLLNFLDVGESSGATRFMTMPEIFNRPDMVNRFGLNCFSNFSKLFLMTDGIYDPKFVVESKLENMESWKNFLRDLNGENEDAIKVDFEEDSSIENQLSEWMDFWSKGNHDDRTLAIIY